MIRKYNIFAKNNLDIAHHPDKKQLNISELPIYFLLLAVIFWLTKDYFPFVDELENLYDSFLISKGYWPYTDYFTNHVAGLHFIIAPLFLIGYVLNNYILHNLGRLFVLILHVIFLKILWNQLYLFFEDKLKKDQIQYSILSIRYLVIIIIFSYLVSSIFMTNLVWSESFLFLYILLSSYYTIKLLNDVISIKDIFIYGLSSGLTILISLTAIALVVCNFCFLMIIILFKIYSTQTKRKFSIFIRKVSIFIGGTLGPMLTFWSLLYFTGGLQDFIFQSIEFNFQVHSGVLNAFGVKGFMGAVLKPLEYLISTCKNITALPRSPLILNNNGAIITGLMNLLLLNIPIIFMVRNQHKLEVKILAIYFLGIFYSSLIRGVGFHVGYGYHFLFVLTVIIVPYLINKKVKNVSDFYTKGILLLSSSVCIVLIYNAAMLNLRLFVNKENFTIAGTGTFLEEFKAKKLLKYFDNKYKLWIPAFLPGDLYFAEILPADPLYMYNPSVVESKYFIERYKNILMRDDILVLPKKNYGNMPKQLLVLIKKKEEWQKIYFPDNIVEFDRARQYLNNSPSIKDFYKIHEMNKNIKFGTKLKGVIQRGYKTSFFIQIDGKNTESNNAVYVLILENIKNKMIHKIELRKIYKRGKFLRIDWDLEFGDRLPEGKYRCGIEVVKDGVVDIIDLNSHIIV